MRRWRSSAWRESDLSPLFWGSRFTTAIFVLRIESGTHAFDLCARLDFVVSHMLMISTNIIHPACPAEAAASF